MPLSLSDIPAEIKGRVEENDYLAECDWGFCGRPTWGFAYSAADPDSEYLTICEQCAAGEFPAQNEFPVEVGRVFPIEAVEKLMWPDGIVYREEEDDDA